MKLKLWSCTSCLFFLLLLFVSSTAHAQKEDEQQKRGAPKSDTASSSSSSFEWESWDFYRILGLDSSKANEISDLDIRKAYRNQAKRHHPDKLIHSSSSSSDKNNNTNTNDKTGTQKKNPATLGKEEVNARFARIAEAYEVLSDPDQRRDYDNWLKHSEQLQRQFAYSPPASKTYDKKAETKFDPFRMFDEFFFGSSGLDDDEDEQDIRRMFSQEAHVMFGQENDHLHSPADEPINIQETKEVLVDEMGNEVLRVTQTRDFKDGSFFVLLQDFVDEWNPYEDAWGYRPLQMQPVLVQSGSRHRLPRKPGQQEGPGNILWPGEFLQHPFYMEELPFRAALSPSCELAVVRRSDTFDTLEQGPDFEATIEWTTKTGLAPWQTTTGFCKAMLQGPHLLIVFGDANTGQEHIVWSSADSEKDWRDELHFFDEDDSAAHDAIHVARLDTDGSLSVYRLEKPSFLWSQLFSLTRAKPALFRIIKLAMGGEFSAKLSAVMATTSSPTSSSSPTLVRLTCVWSSGPARCFRLGRAILRAWRIVQRFADKIL